MVKNEPTEMNVILYRIDTLRNSISGNPRFEFNCDKGIFITESDTTFSQYVSEIFDIGRLLRIPVRLSLSNGKIVDAKVKD